MHIYIYILHMYMNIKYRERHVGYILNYIYIYTLTYIYIYIYPIIYVYIYNLFILAFILICNFYSHLSLLYMSGI